MKHVLPNTLTIFRIVVTPFIIWLMLGFPENFWLNLLAFFLFLIASLTDLFDGMLARKLKVVSEFGKFMDPLADKVLVNATFITLNILGIVPIWITAVIILRDAMVTLLRWAMLAKGASMETSRLAKWKTTFQYISMYVGFVFIMMHHWTELEPAVDFLKEWLVTDIIFAITGLVTAFTGVHYLWLNRGYFATLFGDDV